MSPAEYADCHRQHLLWSLQGLAAAAEVQVSLYPDFAAKPDELAQDFCHWYECARGTLATQWTAPQRAALNALDAKLSRMSRHGLEFSEDLWLEPALQGDPRWAEVRELARSALRVLGWPLESPPRDPESRGTTYVK